MRSAGAGKAAARYGHEQYVAGSDNVRLAERVVVCNDLYILDVWTIARDREARVARSSNCFGIGPTPANSCITTLSSTAPIVAAMARGKVMNSILETADGREILVTNSPMSAGGRVATHNDITERRRSRGEDCIHGALRCADRFAQPGAALRAVAANAGEGRSEADHVAVFCLDLDRFKDVNDAHGHPVGDLLLQSVAGRLRQCIRDADMVARLGGDEFAIVQAGASQPTDATSLASRLIEVIGAPYEIGGRQVTVELSIGIALAPNDGLDPEQLLKNADMALYRAKSDGRGLYRFFRAGNGCPHAGTPGA